MEQNITFSDSKKKTLKGYSFIIIGLILSIFILLFSFLQLFPFEGGPGENISNLWPEAGVLIIGISIVVEGIRELPKGHKRFVLMLGVILLFLLIIYIVLAALY